jgi:hypothetical protein
VRLAGAHLVSLPACGSVLKSLTENFRPLLRLVY